jgi:hypothetical protein
MIKIGLIGAGFMGGTHAACYESLLENGGFKITAVADPQLDRAENLPGDSEQRYMLQERSLLKMAMSTPSISACRPSFILNMPYWQ